MSAAAPIRDRIKELRRVVAGELVENVSNWRRHPAAQVTAMRAILSEIGYADVLIAREDETGKLVLLDGHLRAGLDPKQKVPVLVLDVTEEEGDKILATLDPLAAMADADAGALRRLAEKAKLDDVVLRELVSSLLETATPTDPTLFPKQITAAPAMSWVLVGIPTVRFGEISEMAEKIAGLPGVLCEVVVNDENSATRPPR